MLNVTMCFSSSSSAGGDDWVGRTTALSSSPLGSCLGIDMTSLFTCDEGQAVVKVPVMLLSADHVYIEGLKAR